MNRAERRAYAKKIAKDPLSKKCPICGKKSLLIAIPTHDWLCDIKCELCGNVIEKDVDTGAPYIYC